MRAYYLCSLNQFLFFPNLEHMCSIASKSTSTFISTFLPSRLAHIDLFSDSHSEDEHALPLRSVPLLPRRKAVHPALLEKGSLAGTPDERERWINSRLI